MPATATLKDSGNNISTLAANYTGTICYTYSNGLPLDPLSFPTRRSSDLGIATTNHDVKLTVLAGGLTIGAGADAGADDVTLGLGNLTLNVVGPVTQVAGNVITASGLQLLGSGSVTLNDSGNNISTLAANYSGTTGYTDANA